MRQDSNTSIHNQCYTDCTTCQEAKEIVKTGDEKGYLISKAIKGKFTVITGACTKCASRYVINIYKFTKFCLLFHQTKDYIELFPSF